MLIKRGQDLKYSDITPKSVYMNRRKFLAEAGDRQRRRVGGPWNMGFDFAIAERFCEYEIECRVEEPIQHFGKTKYLPASFDLQQLLRIRYR